MKVIIKQDEGMKPLERHGAWIDLATSEEVTMKQGEARIIPLGIRMKLPEGCEGIVAPRSSTCLKHGIMAGNSIGVIDNEYCGEDDVWGMVAYAIRDTTIPKGTRICQFRVTLSMPTVEFEVVDTMPDENRGGYGSTGTN